MKKISTTLLENWEKIPDNKKDNLLGQMRDMSVFILNLQTEDLKENRNQEIKPKYRNGKKQ